MFSYLVIAILLAILVAMDLNTAIKEYKVKKKIAMLILRLILLMTLFFVIIIFIARLFSIPVFLKIFGI